MCVRLRGYTHILVLIAPNSVEFVHYGMQNLRKLKCCVHASRSFFFSDSAGQYCHVCVSEHNSVRVFVRIRAAVMSVV